MSTTPQGLPQRADNQIAPGTVLFGVYEVLGVLGGGGMGWVYRARHKQLSSLRAIKVIRPDLTGAANMEQLFVREARALMEIHHDAVVRCHDMLSEEGRIYIVMELVEGPSLEEILRDGPITADETRALLQRMASGLAACHAIGVVHRDISPGNIILPGGKADEAKLIDFGVAAVADVPGQTVVGDFKGKLAYASPEQFGLYGGKVEAASDVYTLGLVLAEAASGNSIPMGQTFYEAVEIRKAKPRVPPNVPGDLRDELLPLLDPDPRNRPTAAQLATGNVPKGTSRSATVDDDSLNNRGMQEPPPPQPVSWLVPLIYSATAVGVGIGLGFMAWIYRNGGVPPATPTTTPVSAPTQQSAPTPAPGKKVQNQQSPTPVSAPPVLAKAPPPAPTAPKVPTVPTAPTAPPSTVSNNPPPSGAVSRAQVMNTAAQLAQFTWTFGEANRKAACVRASSSPSNWQPNQKVVGLPYSWGGVDGPDEVTQKLRSGYAAGSHKRDGVVSCATGLDCSAFVAYTWGVHSRTHSFSTSSLGSLATRYRGNAFTDLKPGDALDKPGSHIVLFAGYRADGGPIIYEASGAAGRVIRNEVTWSRLMGYYPVRSTHLVDP